MEHELRKVGTRCLTLKDTAAFGDVTSDVLVRVMTPQDCVSEAAPPIPPTRFMPYWP